MKETKTSGRKLSQDKIFAICCLIFIIAGFIIGSLFAKDAKNDPAMLSLMKKRFAYALDLSSGYDAGNRAVDAYDYSAGLLLEVSPLVLIFFCAFSYLFPAFCPLILFMRSLLSGYGCALLFSLLTSTTKVSAFIKVMIFFALESAAMLIITSFAREANEFERSTILCGNAPKGKHLLLFLWDLAFFAGIIFGLFILRSLFCNLL